MDLPYRANESWYSCDMVDGSGQDYWLPPLTCPTAMEPSHRHPACPVRSQSLSSGGPQHYFCRSMSPNVYSQQFSLCRSTSEREPLMEERDIKPQLDCGGGLVTSDTMSYWSKAQLLPPDTLRRIYGSHFPLEVRHVLAEWIENKPWSDMNVNNPKHEDYARQLLEEMLKQIKDLARRVEQTDFLLKMKLDEAFTQFTNLYTNNPLSLVRVVKVCLEKERQAVQQATNGEVNNEVQTEPSVHRQIMEKLTYLHRCTLETENDLRIMQDNQESFVIHYTKNDNIKSQLQQLQTQQPNNTQLVQQLRQRKDQVEAHLATKAHELRQLRLTFAGKQEESYNLLKDVQDKIVHRELVEWKRRQQLTGNGVPCDLCLDSLQQWCESLADILWQNRQQLKKLEMLRAQLPIDLPPGQEDIIPQLDQAITGLFSSLVTSTFIVENQPPQVLKKDSRFTATVRLLVGGKLNIHMNPLKVEASIISESQARSVLEADRNKPNEKTTCGEILNNSGTMEYQPATGQLSVTFRNMQLKRIKRAERRGTEVHAVTEEKFCIFFKSSFNLGELLFQVWTLSLPVVVTVHGNQECNATATVMWDNAFSKQGRIPFQVPDRVEWGEVAEMLRAKFKSVVDVDLTPDNLNYLATKVFGGSVLDVYTNKVITWSQFNKEPMNSRTFTFWEWFHAILKLSKEYLKDPWTNGSIIGFIGKAQAQDLLMSKGNGTFLLRFSDSEIGGITIAWVADDTTKPGENCRQVWNLAPFSARDFSIRSLADRIKDLPNLVYLYPNIPKDDAFGKNYSVAKEPNAKDGYVHSQLVNRIDDLHMPPNAAPMGPQSPQANGPQSNMSEYGSPISYSTMDTVESQNDLMSSLNVIDCNADDIEQINVNELLARTANGITMTDADFERMMQH